MAINEFDQSLGQNYVSNFVPLPLDNLTRLASLKQGQYNDALDDISKEKNLIGIKYDPRNELVAKGLQKKYNESISGLTDKIVREGYNPQNQRAWIDLKNQIKNDPDRLTIENAHDNYQLYQKDRKELEKKNEYLPEMDSYSYKRADKATPFDYTGLQGKLGWDKSAKDLMGTIKPSGDERKGFNFDADGNILSVKKGSEGVAAKYLKDLSDAKTIDYYHTPEGEQLFNVYKRRGMTDEDALKALSQQLYTSNLHQVGVKLTNENDFNYAPKHVYDKNNPDMPSLPGTSTDANSLDDITKIAPSEIQRGFTTDKDGNVSFDIKKLTEGRFANMKGPGLSTIAVYVPGGGYISKETHQKLAEFANNAARSIGYTKGVKMDNYNEIFNEYNKYSKLLSPQEEVKGPRRDILTNNIIPDRENYTFKENGKIVENNKIPVLNDKNFAVVARTTRNGHQVLKANYIDPSNGETRSFEIEPHSKQSNTFYDISGKVKDNAYNYFKEGKLTDDAKKDVSVFKQALNNSGLSLDKGLEPISFQYVPGSQSDFIVTYSDPKDRKTLVSHRVRLGKDANDKPIVVGKDDINGGLDGVIQHLAQEWYKTPEGREEASQVLPGKDKYSELTQ